MVNTESFPIESWNKTEIPLITISTQYFIGGPGQYTKVGK